MINFIIRYNKGLELTGFNLEIRIKNVKILVTDKINAKRCKNFKKMKYYLVIMHKKQSAISSFGDKVPVTL